MDSLKKLLLVDASYFAYQSFYSMKNSDPSVDSSKNAVLGFCHSMLRMLQRLEPDLAAVVWDGGLPDERKTLLPEYKQQRPPMPPELKAQLPLIRESGEKMGLKNIRVEGQEADDVIATYARQASQSHQVVIATNDKDIFQIVDDRVVIYSTAKKHVHIGETHAILGSNAVSAIWGVANPKLIRDILSLTGDSSDNIPGIPGVGPKTACKLIKLSGGLDRLLAEPIKYANPRISKLIEENKAVVERNVKLVSLNESLPLPSPVEDLRIGAAKEFGDFARSHGFVNLAKTVERWEEKKGKPLPTPASQPPVPSRPTFQQGELGF